MFHFLVLATALTQAAQIALADAASDALPATCGIAQDGSNIIDPAELRSQNGVVKVTLFQRGTNPTNPSQGQIMCYVYRQGGQLVTTPPTLRVKQGDRIMLTLVNDLFQPHLKDQNGPPALSVGRAAGMADDMSAGGGVDLMCGQPQLEPTPSPNPHTGRIYGYHRRPWNESSMHFHGLNTSPKQPGDNVTQVMLCPRIPPDGSPNAYNYVVDIPRDEPPGLYWYHPHAHGESEYQVQLGLTGAIIVDPLASAPIDGMPNRVMIVRDSHLNGDLRPNLNARLQHAPAVDFAEIRKQIAAPSFVANDGRKYPYGNPWQCAPSMKPMINLNSKELSVNNIRLPITQVGVEGVPQTTIPAGQTQFWRLANTASDTVLNLQIFQAGKLVPMQVVSRDSVPLVQKNGHPTWQAVAMDDVVIPPAGRVEFYLTGTTPGSRFIIRAMQFDAGCLGDTELSRDLIVVHVGKPAKHAPPSRAPQTLDPVPTRFADLGFARPAKQRTFAFTEYTRSDSLEPDFYITQMSDPKAVETPFTMNEPPAVVVKDGTVEDWTLLNYTEEVHAFHIHQIHFLVLDAAGMAYGQGQLLDTVVVPYGTFPNGGKRGSQMVPGMVKLRMDFRSKDIVGTFVYHCHLLEHEDNGMMAKIRVLP